LCHTLRRKRCNTQLISVVANDVIYVDDEFYNKDTVADRPLGLELIFQDDDLV